MEVVEIETRDGLQRFPLDKPRLTIGRLPGNDIVLPYTQISRYHAELRQRGEEWWILDLGSTNGLHVAGRVVKEYLLHGGDRVILAPTIIIHFVSQRATPPKIIEGSTTEIPVIRQPIAPSREASSAADEPSNTSADALAAAAAIPLPRRRMAVTPPPANAPRAGRATPLVPVEAPPAAMDEQDLWLVTGEGQTPPAAPKPNAGPTPGDLPLETPYALWRQQHPAPTSALPKKPLLVICPTCNSSTAPDSPYCWNCRQTLARPCPQCQLFLLPIQTKCPRCETPNPNAVRRSS